MGKNGGNSWLTAVKRAFRSPTKDGLNKSCRRRVEHEEDEKKREKKRWLFRKGSSNNSVEQNGEAKLAINNDVVTLETEQRHAIAVAAATAAAAEAAVVTAQAAVEIIRLSTRPANPNSFRLNQAAIIIQSSFRGFLARRALIALKGIVKLQALIRGQNVRKQAKMTLKCMEALLRVQARLRDQRSRLSHDGGRRSMFAQATNFWDSKYLQDIRERKSTSRDGGSIIDEWNEFPRTLEELEAILEARKEASLRRERSLAYAFSQQIWDDKETTKQWDTISRASTDKRDSIKTVEIDTLKPYSVSTNYHHINGRKSQYYSPHHKQLSANQHVAASPRHKTTTHNNFSMVQSPVTPSPSKTRPLQSRPASPARCLEKSYSTANTPSLKSAHRFSTSIGRYSGGGGGGGNEGGAVTAAMPNYMAATESAKAKSRSQSAPRSRPSTPERENRGGVTRKRLSYPLQESSYSSSATAVNNQGFGYNNNFSYNLRSPSFKSVQAGYVGMEQNSCYTDSIGGELSPCSTTDLRRWLR